MAAAKLSRAAWLPVLALLPSLRTAESFAGPRAPLPRAPAKSGRRQGPSFSPVAELFSAPDDDWGLDDDGDAGEPTEDPRMAAMRSLLESSWDGKSMGIVPTSPEKGAEAAAECVAEAMRQNKNVMMVDLRLPSYDITEGPRLYDAVAACDFCTFLSDELRERGLVRKSLILVRNEGERAEIERIRSGRDAREERIKSADLSNGSGGVEAAVGPTEGSDVADFRQNLMASWDGMASEEGAIAGAPQPASEAKASFDDDSSHRLWSMVGDETVSTGPDMFDQVIGAVDQHAILAAGEDALIILSPYDTSDVVAIRRILARYGQTRTIIIVNSRMETLPRELNPAVLVYSVLPLIARARGKDDTEAGVKVVAMKRFPAEWAVFVDAYGDGFEEARGPGVFADASGKALPEPEWIARRVQAHVEGLSKQQ